MAERGGDAAATRAALVESAAPSSGKPRRFGATPPWTTSPGAFRSRLSDGW